MSLKKLLNETLKTLDEHKIFPKNTSFKDRVISHYIDNTKEKLQKIITSETTEEDLIKHTQSFLKENWELIKGSLLSYTALPHSDITRHLCILAEYIARHLEEPAICILMPTVAFQIVDLDYYPNLTHLALDVLIKTHILGQNAAYLIPVSLLTEYSLDDFKQRRIVNPYNDAHQLSAEKKTRLSPEEINRLTEHSSRTRFIGQRIQEYIQLPNDISLDKEAKASLASDINYISERYKESVESLKAELENADYLRYLGCDTCGFTRKIIDTLKIEQVFNDSDELIHLLKWTRDEDKEALDIEKVVPLIKKAIDFRNILRELIPKQRTCLYTRLKNQVPFFIEDAEDFDPVLFYLSPEQRTEVTKVLVTLKREFVLKVFHYQSSELQTEILNTILKGELPKFFNSVDDFNDVCSHLSLKEQTKVLNALKEKRLDYLIEEAYNYDYADNFDNPKYLDDSGHLNKFLLGQNGKKAKVLGKLLSIIQECVDFTGMLSDLDEDVYQYAQGILDVASKISQSKRFQPETQNKRLFFSSSQEPKNEKAPSQSFYQQPPL